MTTDSALKQVRPISVLMQAYGALRLGSDQRGTLCSLQVYRASLIGFGHITAGQNADTSVLFEAIWPPISNN